MKAKPRSIVLCSRLLCYKYAVAALLPPYLPPYFLLIPSIINRLHSSSADHLLHSMNNQPQHISTLTHLLMFLPSGLLTSMITILDLFTPRTSLQTRKLDTSTMPANIARGSGSLRRRAVGKFIQHHSYHVRNSMDDWDSNASGKVSQRFELRWQVVCILSVSASADG